MVFAQISPKASAPQRPQRCLSDDDKALRHSSMRRCLTGLILRRLGAKAGLSQKGHVDAMYHLGPPQASQKLPGPCLICMICYDS